MNKRIILILPLNTPTKKVNQFIDECFSLCYKKIVIKFYIDEFTDLKKTSSHFNPRILDKIRHFPINKNVSFNIELTTKTIKQISINRPDVFIDFYIFPDDIIDSFTLQKLNSLIKQNTRIDFNIIDLKDVPYSIRELSHQYNNNVDFYETTPVDEEKIELSSSKLNIPYFMNDYSPPIIFEYKQTSWNLYLFTNHRFFNTQQSFSKIPQYDQSKQSIYDFLTKHPHLLLSN